jgi:hypothetical protein
MLLFLDFSVLDVIYGVPEAEDNSLSHTPAQISSIHTYTVLSVLWMFIVLHASLRAVWKLWPL